MNTYIAVVFSSGEKTHLALRKLWNLAEEGALTVHGAAIVHRDGMATFAYQSATPILGCARQSG
jgi:hypothetical protein